MTSLPKPCVVDASVGIRLFLPEEHAEQVQKLFESALDDPTDTIFVPDLFFIECANVLWKKVRRGEYSQDMARQNLADLRALGLPTTPTSELMARALEIACEHGVTAYDACYVALAEMKEAPLLTADSRLRDALTGAFDVTLLGE